MATPAHTYPLRVVVDAELREFAEAPERFVEVPKDSTVERFDDERRCIVRDRTWATVTAIRAEPDSLDDLLADVRGVVPSECEAFWHVGPSSRPANLLDELARRGFVPPTHRPREVSALALISEPERVEGVDVRRADGFEQFLAAREAAWEAFDAPEARREIERPHLREGFEEMERTGIPALFLAYLDGRLAGSAVAIPSRRGVLLGGGSVAPWARGRGLYRALVRARWEYALGLGAPALVTHANLITSYPILLRLGFEEVGRVHRLVDAARPAD